MAITLSKGQRIEVGLSHAGIGVGWDPREGTGHDFDLDACLFMLGENGKIPAEPFFVFYNNRESPDGAVGLSEDDRTGASSDGDDDETLNIDFAKLDLRVRELLIAVTIHEAEQRKQNFGQVRNSFIRIYDGKTQELICKYELDEDFSTETAVEFGRLYKRGGGWKFEAMGRGFQGGLEYLLGKYS